MLYNSLHVTETILAFALIVLLVVLLKKKNIVSSGDIKSYTRLMTTAIMPAVIFLQLSTNPVNSRQFILVLIMFLAGLASMVVTWIIGKFMRLKRETLGMLIISSTFGSSSLIGYPLIQFAFPGNVVAMSDAILISELGVGVPIFTLCPLVASYYGSGNSGMFSMWKTIVDYLKSPLFISVVAGILFSQFQGIVNNPFLAPMWQALRMIEGTLTVLACLILGLQLKFGSAKKIMPLFIVSSIIQIGVQPFFTSFGADLVHAPLLDKQVLILIAAMPSAVLGTVFATQYECDGEAASEMVFLNIMVSLIGIPLVYYFMFR
ncbi:MAG: AEC family transporter [Bacteroidales bacterium]